jgi:hypothetical protein
MSDKAATDPSKPVRLAGRIEAFSSEHLHGEIPGCEVAVTCNAL